MQAADSTTLIGKILAQLETKVSSAWIAKTLGINTCTGFRWMTRGIKTPVGIIKLESTVLGGRIVTTREAVQRFMEAVAAARSGTTGETAEPVTRSPSARTRASEKAGKQLEAMEI